MGRRQHGEGSVYQRKDRGQWVAVENLGWRQGPSGKLILDRREFTGATPAEAMARRERFRDRRRDGFTMPKGRQPYVSEWLLHWLHVVAKREVRASTWERSYRQKVEELIVPYFERTPLPELSEEDIEEWHAELERRVSAHTGRPLSPGTITQAHRIMSRALKVAVARKRIGRNPCQNVTPPQPDPAEPQPPGREDMARILARCETWPNGPRWVLAATTGLRQGEALALEWRDVNLKGERPTVSVRKGKTRSATRTIDLPAVTVAALKRQREQQIVRDLRDGLVFTRKDGRPVHPTADFRDWHALLDDLGLPRCRVHDLRHATATFLLEAGEDIRVVQAIMGHATPDFTRRQYQHVRPVLTRRAAANLDEYLKGG